jgi:hypothetical protein
MQEITRLLYLSDLDHLVVREWVNGIWFAISFAMCFEFSLIIARRIKMFGAAWREDLGTRAVAALLGYFTAETMMRGWIWTLLALQNAGSPLVEQVQADYWIALVAAALAVWSVLCCLYVFSRNHWAWARAAVIIIVFVIVETIIL